MKKLFTLFLILICIAAYSEYQVFDFKATIKTFKRSQVVENGRVEPSWGISTDTLKGYLVTVCCYPCGADMGKGYPSWLFVVRGKDSWKTLWKIPVDVNGAITGQSVSIDKLTDYERFIRYDTTKSERNYVKKANQAWMIIQFDTTEAIPVMFKVKKIHECMDKRIIWRRPPGRI